MEKRRTERFYDGIYSDTDAAFSAKKPDDFVVKAVSYLPTGEALELGAGQGRNALWLAEHGFKVEATDVSEVGIAHINRKATEKGLDVKAAKIDSREAINKTYDIIVSTYVLYYLKRTGALAVIEQMKSHTRSGGLNVISTFTVEGDFYKRNPKAWNFFAELGELRELYKDWEVLEYDEVSEQAAGTNTDGTPMFNVSAKIIARKK